MAIVNRADVKKRFADLAGRYSKAEPSKRPELTKGSEYQSNINKRQSEEVRHASSKSDSAFAGKGRAMTATEKRLYVTHKRLDEKKELVTGTRDEKKAKQKEYKEKQRKYNKPTDDEVTAAQRASFREKFKRPTTVRKRGVGLYSARVATAKDLDERAKLPTKSAAWKSSTYARFKK